jgi:hypothetical protein
MDVIGDPAIMLHDSSGIDNAVLPDHSAWIDNRSGHNDTAGANPDRCSHSSGMVNEDRRHQLVFAGAPQTPLPTLVVPYCDHACTPLRTLQLVLSAQHWKTTMVQSGSVRIIVQEGVPLEDTGTARAIQNDLAVTAGAPDQQQITHDVPQFRCP